MTQILTKKTKIYHGESMMLNSINNKKIPFKTVLMDSRYSIQRLMALNVAEVYEIAMTVLTQTCR